MDKKNFDWGMHYFRGFAICAIVINHMAYYLGHESFQWAWLKNGTIFFLFISGYLCQFLDSRRRSSPMEYYSKKLKNVISPYLICTTLTVLAVWAFQLDRCGVITPDKLTLRMLLHAYLRGIAQGPYWYIPFISLVFLASPLLVRLRTSVLALVTIVAFSLAAIFPERGAFVFSPVRMLELYIYFSWSYLLGMVYARAKTIVDPWINRHAWMFLILGAFCGLWIVRPDWLGMVGANRCFLSSIQKVFFTIVVLAIFNRIRNRRIWLLDQFATYSFTLFFLHQFFISDLVWVCGKITPILDGGMVVGILCEVMFGALFLLALVLVSAVLKRILGKNSRCVIGA